MPRTIAVAFFERAKSAVNPEKLSTTIAQSLVHTDGKTSRIISQRSSTLNIGCLSALFNTAMTISSKRGELRVMISRWPFVSGSNDPGNTARLIYSRSEFRFEHFLRLRGLLLVFRKIRRIRFHLQNEFKLLFRFIVAFKSDQRLCILDPGIAVKLLDLDRLLQQVCRLLRIAA